MKILVAPSLLSADFGNLKQDIEFVNQSQADWFHLDIMDGVFVPNLSLGFPIISAIKKYATKPLDVHLMIIDPDRYLERFKNLGADILTVHFEACTHLHRTVNKIKQLGMKAGIALNPHTPIHLLEDIITEVDLILVMSVNPGFGGQEFIRNTFDKISKLRKLITEKQSTALIEVDGGVDLNNAKELVIEGTNVLVSGNSIFTAQNREEVINKMKNL